jgi:hypothetical protein
MPVDIVSVTETVPLKGDVDKLVTSTDTFNDAEIVGCICTVADTTGYRNRTGTDGDVVITSTPRQMPIEPSGGGGAQSMNVNDKSVALFPGGKICRKSGRENEGNRNNHRRDSNGPGHLAGTRQPLTSKFRRILQNV